MFFVILTYYLIHFVHCNQCSSRRGIDTNETSETYGSCIPCQVVKCADCDDDAYQCQICGEGTYLNLDEQSKTYEKCVTCPQPHCSECNESRCIKCIDGYGVDEKGSCTKCSKPNCTICSANYTYCEKCNSESQLGAWEGFCLPSLYENCIIPTEDSALYCRKCKPGYFLSIGNCYPCKPYCKSCTDKKCIECFSGYSLLNDQCIECGENCDICDPSDSTCYYCKSGYIMNSDSETCSRAYIDNCQTYVNSYKCRVCDWGYGVDDNEECSKCFDENCVACARNYKNCITCKTGYSSVDGKCVKGKAPNCGEFGDNDPNACKRCMLNYGFDYDGKCTKCSDSNCRYCSNDNEYCTECKDGYLAISGNCKPCTDPNCESCYSGISKCSFCKQGYRLDFQQKCEKCTFDNCGKCSYVVSVCDKCMDSYGFSLEKNGNNNFGQCVKCSVNGCKSCDHGLAYCDSCYDDYELVNNECVGAKKDSKKLSTAAIAGIVVGCVVVVGIIIGVIVYFLVCRKKVQVSAEESE